MAVTEWAHITWGSARRDIWQCIIGRLGSRGIREFVPRRWFKRRQRNLTMNWCARACQWPSRSPAMEQTWFRGWWWSWVGQGFIGGVAVLGRVVVREFYHTGWCWRAECQDTGGYRNYRWNSLRANAQRRAIFGRDGCLVVEEAKFKLYKSKTLLMGFLFSSTSEGLTYWRLR